MTQEAVQFSGGVFVGSRRAIPACFTDRRVTPLPGAPSPNLLNRAGKKVSCGTFSTGTKAPPMPTVTHYTNAHSCWSDFCSPA